MPDVTCHTSPIQCLYQVELLHALARRAAAILGLRVTGTPGLLLDAKRAGLIPAIAPILDQLHALRFRLASHTRSAVLGGGT